MVLYIKVHDILYKNHDTLIKHHDILYKTIWYFI